MPSDKALGGFFWTLAVIGSTLASVVTGIASVLKGKSYAGGAGQMVDPAESAGIRFSEEHGQPVETALVTLISPVITNTETWKEVKKRTKK